MLSGSAAIVHILGLRGYGCGDRRAGPSVMVFLYAAFMAAPGKPSRSFMGLRPIFHPCQTDMGEAMFDLAFVVLGAVLFLGALIYARACAQV